MIRENGEKEKMRIQDCEIDRKRERYGKDGHRDRRTVTQAGMNKKLWTIDIACMSFHYLYR